MRGARNVELRFPVRMTVLGARWVAAPLLILALLATESLSRVTESAAKADSASGPRAIDSNAPPDCEAWQKATINLPRMAGPFHNHEVEPQIEAEQAKQMAVGVRCLASELHEMVVLGNSFLADHRSAPEHAVWQQLSEALLAETTSLNAVTLRVDSLTAAINIQLSLFNRGADPKPPGAKPRPNGKDTNYRADLDDFMQAMRSQEQRLSNLTAAIESALEGAKGASGSSPAAPTPSAAPPSAHPLNIDEPLSSHYGHRADSDTAFAIVTVPDPSVPGHRRAYDLAVAALTEGMIRARFVLDDFRFPSDPMPTAAGGDGGDGGDGENCEKASFGLMIFLRDDWRERSNNRAALGLRALYLVPETAPYGVRPCALKQALLRILNQQRPTKDISVFGPSFSGSLDSLLNAARALGWAPPEIQSTTPARQKVESAKSTAAAVEDAPPSACASTAAGSPFIPCVITYSPSATVKNNDQIGEPIHYHTLAVSDDIKMHALSAMAHSLGVDSNNVAVVYEDTVFGVEVSTVARAEHFDRIPVPVNIADVRYGFADHQAKTQSKPPIDLAVLDQHLALDEGAENGSEFPIEESRLTPASSELALRATLDAVEARHYRIVAVVATDVRDRLFLFDRLRAALPSVQLVDLATDRLLSHPDFVHASRGVITIGSRELGAAEKNQKTSAPIRACGATKPTLRLPP